MDFQDYIKTQREVQALLLQCIENKEKQEDSYNNLINLFESNKILENPTEIKEFLYLLVRVANKHHRTPDFFSVIERFISYFKEQMKQFYSNYEIFNLFKSNKRLLLTLFEEQIIVPDQSIASTLSNGKFPSQYYLNYFYPEFKDLMTEKVTQEVEMTNCRFTENKEAIDYASKSFIEKRKIGENDDVICQIIQKDSVDEFTSYTKRNNVSLSMKIKPSIYETNSFLLSKSPTLIEYSAFCNAVQVFNYLFSKNVELSPSLWIFAIRGQSNDIINILKKNKIQPKDKSYKECVIKSISCHHLEITNFLMSHFLKGKSIESLNINQQLLKSYNFFYFPNDIGSDFNAFYDLCQNNYVSLVQKILESSNININSKRIAFICLNKISNDFLN